MRSLGDARWINDYIGIPYRAGGRDDSGVDCYGLAVLVYREEYGETLPDWQIDPINLKDRAATIEAVVCSGDWTEKEHPGDGDFVVCHRSKMAYHIGLFFAGGVLHALEGTGVVFEPLAQFAERFARIEFGEWRP